MKKTTVREPLRQCLASFFSALLVVLIFFAIHLLSKNQNKNQNKITVGFVYTGDASTLYTENFIQSQHALSADFGDRVHIIARYNVSDQSSEQVIRNLAAECDIIFSTSYGFGEAAKKIAGEFPSVQICQATCSNANTEPVYKNYHTFMGEIYQGRYICGLIAGLKINELVEQGIIAKDKALVGYIAAFPIAEITSGYTAFFLGLRVYAPYAVMKVAYIGAWSNFLLEKSYTKALIQEGCVIIAHHTDSAASAIACEEDHFPPNVYHVGYNQNMQDVAPTTSLIGTRIYWTPYIRHAVKAVLQKRSIEKGLKASIHGTDAGAGFEEDWVQMLELNQTIAPEGSEKIISEAIEKFKKKKLLVFYGDYIGEGREDKSATYNLLDGFLENENQSAPCFNYVLRDVIFEEL